MTKRHMPLYAILGLFCLSTLSACSTSNKLRARADAIKAQNSSIESRAYRCAPRQLAAAKSFTEFGLYELKQGNFVRAKNHLVKAEVNAKRADEMSDFDECKNKKVAMNIKATPKTKIIKAKALPKDQDGDGILDDKDKCPTKPEDFDKYQDADGCPEADNDNDGIADESDACPDVAEDKDNFQDKDGCPEFDNDGDGIADINDQCRNKAEDFDGFQDDDGCDDPDNDGDQIVDILDQCPNKAEDYDGDKDSDGCPEERKLVRFENGQIKLNQKVFFKTGKAKIRSVSFPLLNEVVVVLKENPKIHIRVEGHTDDKGKDRDNQRLSERRAKSVRVYLENAGIGSTRMVSIGKGEKQPIEDNATPEGRAANRRVEIHITKK